MSNQFEKIREDQLNKKQKQAAEDAERHRQHRQAEQRRKQAGARYDELVRSVLRELQATLYPGQRIDGSFFPGDFDECYTVYWNIGRYYPAVNDNKGVYICLIFDPGSNSTCFDQNAHPICFECVVKQDFDFHVAPKTERTHGLTRQELTEVLVRLHS